jgi:adenylate kinase family enzyme
MRGRTIIFTIGNMCSGKSTISKMMEEYMGYKRISVRKATLDLINMLKDCNLKKKIINTLYSGNATDDNLIIEILNRRITMEDLINENIVIDGFPYTLTQANLITENLIPNLIFVAQCEIQENLKRCLAQKLFKGIPEVVNERNYMLKTHLIDILEVFKSKLYDIRYFDMTKSKWFIKEQISNLLENRKKFEMKFARNYSLDKPCQLTYLTPKKLLNSILYSSHNKCNLLIYSTVALKGNHLFRNNGYVNNSFNNHIVYTPDRELTQNEIDQIEEEAERKKEEEDLIKAEEEKKRLKEEKIKKKKEEEERLDKEIENPEIVYEENKNKENNNEEVQDNNNLDENNIIQNNENLYNVVENTSSNRKPRLTTESENIEVGNEKLQTDNNNIENDFSKPFITRFHFLTNDDEIEQFDKNVQGYQNYLIDMSKEILPPKILKPEEIAEVLYTDEDDFGEEEQNEESEDNNEKESIEVSEDENQVKFSLNIHYEYQECCPVTIVEDKLMRMGKISYSIRYCNKYYKFLSMDKMMKFKLNPNKYINLSLPVKKVNEENNEQINDKQISFENTVNFLEFTFGSLITKGMLELSTNRIKYPYLNVKESSLKYLALYLKANNPNNNEYAKKKYKEILREFLKNSKLPFELYSVYDNYNKEKENPLHKQLIRKQLDNVSNKYDELMEKAKIQNNTRFANFFKRNVEQK